MFTPAFREVLGVPLNYDATLQRHGPSSLAVDAMEVGDDSAESIRAGAMVADAPDATHTDAMEIFESNSRSADEGFDIPELTDGLLSPLQQSESVSRVGEATVCHCSMCHKSFRKSKAHQGSRCWACKKSKSRAQVDNTTPASQASEGAH